jgi:hypothetical protein
MFYGPRCFEGMDGASYYRERADHLRRLAEMTWQRDLEGMVRSLAQDYDETAEDLEAGWSRRDRCAATSPSPSSFLYSHSCAWQTARGGYAKELTELPESGVISGGDEDLAGSGLELGIGNEIRVRVAGRRRPLSA